MIASLSAGVKSDVKSLPVPPDQEKKFEAIEGETEDLAESVDSGCIPDSSSDIMADVMNTAQVMEKMMDYKFMYILCQGIVI